MPVKKTAPKKAKKTTAKKATKKTVAKKSTIKKAAPRKAAAKKKTTTNTKSVKKAPKRSGRVLVCADGQACFWTTDGQILKDLTELSDALEHMADEVFAHHVSKEKNDFADWVESVLEDSECASALRKSRKPHTARTVVVRRLKQYEF